MATFSDIMDWLNQGAEGDIPGTGQPQATPASSSQPQYVPPGPPTQPVKKPGPIQVPPSALPNFDDLSQVLGQYHAIANTPRGEDIQFDRSGTMTVTGSGLEEDAPRFGPTPADYSGDIPPSLLPQYQALVKGGLPPMVAHQILTQPSYAEGQRPHSTPQWTPPQGYAGDQPDPLTGRRPEEIAPYAGQPTDYDRLLQSLSNMWFYDKQNWPTEEGQMRGAADTTGLWRLPTGQFAPLAPPGSSSALDYWRQQSGNPSSFWWNPAPNSFEGQKLLNQQQAQQQPSGDEYFPPPWTEGTGGK